MTKPRQPQGRAFAAEQAAQKIDTARKFSDQRFAAEQAAQKRICTRNPSSITFAAEQAAQKIINSAKVEVD